MNTQDPNERSAEAGEYVLGTLNAAERQAFFRKELEHFLVQEHAVQHAPTAALGSFAGARGMPQFMPTSIKHYAVHPGWRKNHCGRSASCCIHWRGKA